MVLLGALAVIVGGHHRPARRSSGGCCAGQPGVRGVVVLRGARVGPDLGRVAADRGTGGGVPVAVGLAFGERPGAVAGVGIVLALVAVVLVSREATDEDVRPHRFTTKVAWLTVGSGLAFGLTSSSSIRLRVDARLWPLFFARLSATAVVLIARR